MGGLRPYQPALTKFEPEAHFSVILRLISSLSAYFLEIGPSVVQFSGHPKAQRSHLLRSFPPRMRSRTNCLRGG